MAWPKTPIENHELFRAALPRDPRIVQTRMFGCLVALVHGRMSAATFGRSVFIRLAPDDRADALHLDGAEIFDPMSKGGMREMVLFPETIMDEPEELRVWLQRGLAYAATLPPKATKRQKSAKPANKVRGVKEPLAKQASPARTRPVAKKLKSRG
jgi:hypothetical protein